MKRQIWKLNYHMIKPNNGNKCKGGTEGKYEKHEQRNT